MKLKQLSIFLDKQDRLKEVVAALSDGEVNILTLTLSDAADFSVLRLIVDKPDAAFVLLSQRDISVVTAEIVAVEVADDPDALSNILSLVDREGIAVEYLYAFSEKASGNIVLIFRFDDMDCAIDVLKKDGLKILSEKAIGIR